MSDPPRERKDTPTHTSKFPGESKKRNFRLDDTGGSASWKGIIVIILTIVGGGGGGAYWQLASRADVDKAILDHTIQVETLEAARHDQIDKRMDKQDKILTGFTVKIDLVEKRQVRQIATDEAKLAVEKIQNREARDREFSRIRDSKIDELTADTERKIRKAQRALKDP